MTATETKWSIRTTAVSAGLLFSSFSGIVEPASAEEIHVYEGDSIQSAIESSANGDVIIVHEGAYDELVNLLGKAITLRSTDPTDPDVVAKTIISAWDDPAIVTCDHGEGPDTVISGFTIADAQATFFGGGMLNWGSSPTVTHCTFLNNSTTLAGGGLCIYEGSSTIASCKFIGNDGGIWGGGMCNWESTPTVRDCTFIDNTSTFGGGMQNMTFSDALVIDCKFIGNSASEGGGIDNAGGSPLVMNCTFIENEARGNYGKGGGARNSGNNAVMMSCTFTGNSATERGGGADTTCADPVYLNCTFLGNSAGIGGGLSNNCACNQARIPTVVNCTFTHNVADSGGDGIYNYKAHTVVRNCILWSNTPDEIFNESSLPSVTYSCVGGGYEGVGNIRTDPLFAGGDDLRLQAGSPCIDGGFNNAIPTDMHDVDGDGVTCERLPVDPDGNPRFTNDLGTPDTGCGLPVVVDMGAYEFAGEVADVILGDVNGSGVVDSLDLLAVLDDWGVCDDCRLGDVNGDGWVDIDDVFAVLGGWGSCP